MMFVKSRRRFLASLGGMVAGGALGAWSMASKRGVDENGLVSRAGHALGTTVSLKVVHPDRTTADAALDAAFAAIDAVEETMSLYRPHSQLARLNRARFLPNPHPDLVTVLLAAEALSRQSGGAFDATVQPLWTAFASATRGGRLPTDLELASARAKVGWERVEIGRDAIRLRGEGTAVTLNGIAQGFAVDRVIDALRGHGIEQALIDAGELAGLGRRPDASAWRVGVQDPRVADAFVALADLDGRCLATSGDYATAFDSTRRDHHIVDPRTGRSPGEVASVSVVAPSGLWADGLSTTLCVTGPTDGLRLVESMPGCDALFIFQDGRTAATPGFPAV